MDKHMIRCRTLLESNVNKKGWIFSGSFRLSNSVKLFHRMGVTTTKDQSLLFSLSLTHGAFKSLSYLTQEFLLEDMKSSFR